MVGPTFTMEEYNESNFSQSYCATNVQCTQVEISIGGSLVDEIESLDLSNVAIGRNGKYAYLLKRGLEAIQRDGIY